MNAARYVITVLIVLAIVLLLGWLGPSLDEPDAAQATADDLRDAQHQAALQLRCDRAPHRPCPSEAAP